LGAKLELIVVNPDSEIGSRDLSQNIIQGLMKTEIVDVVGMGSSIGTAIAGINASRAIANVNIQCASVDYVTLTAAYKPDAIFVELSRIESKAPSIVQKFEKQDYDSRRTKTVGVSRDDRLEEITNIILWKLSKNDIVKVMASGFAIPTAIKSVLQVTTTGISKSKVGITGITLDSVERGGVGGGTGKLIPAIQIYIEKNKETVHSARHQEVLNQITAR
jgi:hypothetical protein